MLEGRIVEYGAALGYGYLRTACGLRLFVHSTETHGLNGRPFRRGRCVTFDIYKTEKAAVAIDIRPVKPAKRRSADRK